MHRDAAPLHPPSLASSVCSEPGCWKSAEPCQAARSLMRLPASSATGLPVADRVSAYQVNAQLIVGACR
jgi:hypothetical protein